MQRDMDYDSMVWYRHVGRANGAQGKEWYSCSLSDGFYGGDVEVAREDETSIQMVRDTPMKHLKDIVLHKRRLSKTTPFNPFQRTLTSLPPTNGQQSWMMILSKSPPRSYMNIPSRRGINSL